MAELKFREKGVFKSEPRARAYAETLKQKGKRVRVERLEDPQYGRIYSVRVWAAQEFRGRNFKIDLIRGR
jgi:hypothetical protein